VKDVQLDRRGPAAAWSLARSRAGCRIVAAARPHHPENPRAPLRYLIDGWRLFIYLSVWRYGWS